MNAKKAGKYLKSLDPSTKVVVLPLVAYSYLRHNGGVSSEVMLEHLMGIQIPGGGSKQHPLDSDGFGRCLGLLNAIPELRPKIGDMSSVSPEWKAIVNKWNMLEGAYHARPSRTQGETFDQVLQKVIDQAA
jgi:hypothetical protein